MKRQKLEEGVSMGTLRMPGFGSSSPDISSSAGSSLTEIALELATISNGLVAFPSPLSCTGKTRCAHDVLRGI